jgi:5-methylcytosine-specific restriction endonuclease McrA
VLRAAGWRSDSHRRRARRYGVEYQPIKPRDIFERDGWRCGLCGSKVARLRQSPDPLSATLDHIVPISLGGAHLPANVQCAHRRCNEAKGVGGSQQMRLVG